MTPARLSRVERAEVSLRAVLAAYDVEVSDLRVRDLGDQARVELDAGALAAASADAALMAACVEGTVGVGFASAYVDPGGFRSGSMNELLVDQNRYR